MNEYNIIPELNDTINNIYGKLRNLKIIDENKKSIKKSIATITAREKGEFTTASISMPSHRKIVNKVKPIFKLNSSKYKIKIILKIEL